MATIKVTRCDLFPVGTVVGLYPRGAGHRLDPALPPSGTAVATATVASAGTLEWSSGAVEAATEYSAAASVGGSWARLQVASDAFVEPGTLAERIEARRAEVGA